VHPLHVSCRLCKCFAVVLIWFSCAQVYIAVQTPSCVTTTGKSLILFIASTRTVSAFTRTDPTIHCFLFRRTSVEESRVLHPNGIPTFFERFSENPNSERSELMGNPNAAERRHWAKPIAEVEPCWDSPTLGSCNVGMIPGRNEAGERSEAYGIPDQAQAETRFQ
jgi:hypothetical protein